MINDGLSPLLELFSPSKLFCVEAVSALSAHYRISICFIGFDVFLLMVHIQTFMMDLIRMRNRQAAGEESQDGTWSISTVSLENCSVTDVVLTNVVLQA